jgi:hypothetical protein
LAFQHLRVVTGNRVRSVNARVARKGIVMNGPKKRAVGLAANGPSHELSESREERAVNEAGVIFFEAGAVVPVVNGWKETAFDAELPEIVAFMTPRERTTYEMRMAAVRYVAGIEPRSLAEIGADLGVGRAAVSRVVRDVLARLGCRQVVDNAEKRWKLAEAARRTLNSRKAA